MGTKIKVTRSAVANEITLVSSFDDFIEEKQALGKSADTIRNYKLSFRLFTERVGIYEDFPTEKLTSSYIFKFINTSRNEGVKVTSINHYLRDIRTFVNWCISKDLIPVPFTVEMVKGQEEPLKHFTDEELEMLLEKPRKKDTFAEWRSWTIVNWVLGTGNRASTFCAVKIGDIDFKKKEITLAHTKNKKAQIIPLSAVLITVLKEYMKMWRQGASSEDYLFCNIGEEKLTTNAARLAFTKYCKDRGVSKTTLHGLRHNFAKAWVKNNGRLVALQQILGHSTLEMTRKYIKLFAEDLKEDFESFTALDTIKKKAKRTQTVKRSS